MVSKFAKQLAGNRKGQGLVEYGILAAGVALIALVSVSVLGHKTSSMIATLAAILPGTEPADFGAVTSGSLIETSSTGSQVQLDPDAATNSLISGTDRLDVNVGINNSADPAAITGTSVLAVDPDGQ